MSRAKVVVMGASGFAGAELLRRLLQHPNFEILRVCAADHTGEKLSAAHPHLEGRSSLRFENPTPEEAVRGADAVLMGLPHTVSVEVVKAIGNSPVRVVDLSGAFRFPDAEAYAKYYGQAHPAPELLGDFVYGLPELKRKELRGAGRVASPGCFATTIELGLLPLAHAGLLRGHVTTVASTGSSGSGQVPSAATHHPVRAQNLRTYRPLLHQHTPEIEHVLRQAGASDFKLSFVPVSAPLTRGIFATSVFEVPEELDEADVESAFQSAYQREPFVRIPEARLPEVVAVAHSNYAEVGFTLGPRGQGSRSLAVFSALDNLIKGGAGQAIQNLNLMFGLDERLTLEEPGGYP